MAFLRKLFKGVSKQKRDYPNIRQGADPLEQWQKVGELGDGSFGKVYKVTTRTVATGGGKGRVQVITALDDRSPN